MKLESITMRRNQISDISVLANLPLLKDLNLRDNQITSIEALRNHQFLTVRLNLRDNEGLTDLSPVASYYDQIEDVDFVIPQTGGKDLSDLDLLEGEARSASLTQRLIQHNQYIQHADVRQSKLQSLGASPFAFYRGSAHLFFEDAAADGLVVPNTWKNQSVDTWITGDWHIENIGFYGNGHHEAIFDFNDFDEVAVAPYYYDLLRFGTSLYLLNDVAPGLQLDFDQMEDVLMTFSDYYQEGLQDVINQEVDVQNFRFTHNELTGIVGSTATEISEGNRFAELGRWTQMVDGERQLDTSNARLAEISDDERAEVVNHWNTYLEGISDQILNEVGEDYFTIKDVARRTDAGLGSLGTERFYVLIEGETSGQQDDIILDVKSQLPSAVDKAGVGQTPEYPTHADRTIAGMSAMHNHPDIHWGRLIGEDHSYLVKERSSYKDEFDQSSFSNAEDLDSFLYYSAKASSYAHVRAAATLGSSNFAQEASALMNQDTFNREFADLSLQYYGQTLKDHELYRALYQAGAFSEEAFEPTPPPTDGEEPTPTPPPTDGRRTNTNTSTNRWRRTNANTSTNRWRRTNTSTNRWRRTNTNTSTNRWGRTKPRNTTSRDDDGTGGVGNDDNKTNTPDPNGNSADPGSKSPTVSSPHKGDSPIVGSDRNGGETLPNTATAFYNYLAIGLTLLSLGAIVYILQWRKRTVKTD